MISITARHVILGTPPPFLTCVEQIAGIKESARERFELGMMGIIEAARSAASDDPALVKGAKKAGHLARELKAALDNPDLSRHLEFFGIEGVSYLAERLRELEQLKKGGRPKKWAETIRKHFVNGLLDAVHDAGGELGVNRRNGRGSLVDAISELTALSAFPIRARTVGSHASPDKSGVAKKAKK